jgi:hypothetical protein
MERTPAGIRPIFSALQPVADRLKAATVLLLRTFGRSRGSLGSRGSGRVGGRSSSGIHSSSVASGGGGITSGVDGLAGSFGGLIGSSRGVGSGFLRGFNRSFFLLRAAGEGQGGKGGGECKFRVHGRYPN